jgi:AraC family transcriptional regulator of adaptative response / DNA-3-methyladenine glycosylase II
LSGRIAAAFGEPIETPFASLTLLSPTAQRLARARETSLVKHGLRWSTAASVRALAAQVAGNRLVLEPSADPEAAVQDLLACRGIGPWTAQYIAMRALRWPGAFPHGDLGLLKASGERTARALAARAEAWRPWRAYAAMYLWESLHSVSRTSKKTAAGSRS